MKYVRIAFVLVTFAIATAVLHNVPQDVAVEEASTVEEVMTTEVSTTLPIKKRIVVPEETTTEEVQYDMYFTETDIIMVAKTIYGEAGADWISREEKACVAWVICNRVDDKRWDDTIAEVITAPYQFHGYRPSNPVTDECYEIALDVLTRWSLEKQGVAVERELEKHINSFYGDGRRNYFYAC